MKQNFFLIFCLALLAGCDINKGFTIDGVVPDVENGRTIYLVALAMNSQWDTLGMSVVENGKFKIEGKIPEPRIAQIRGIEKRQSIPLFLENVPFLVKGSISDLNIRKGPGIDYGRTGKFTGPGVFTILEVKPGKGASAGWGRLKSGAGWISLDYAKRI